MKVVEFILSFKSDTQGIIVIKPIMLISEQMLSNLENILNDDSQENTFIAITSKDYNGEKLL